MRWFTNRVSRVYQYIRNMLSQRWLRRFKCTCNRPQILHQLDSRRSHNSFRMKKTQGPGNLSFSGAKWNLIRIANLIRIVLLYLFSKFLALLEWFVEKNCQLSFLMTQNENPICFFFILRSARFTASQTKRAREPEKSERSFWERTYWILVDLGSTLMSLFVKD